MKKVLASLGLSVMAISMLFAQADNSLVLKIQQKVTSLLTAGYEKVNTVDAELVVLLPTIADTGNGSSESESVGRLSEFLRDKIEDSAIAAKLWAVKKPTRGDLIKTSITGKITTRTTGAEVRLTLESGDAILARETFSITQTELESNSLTVLPPNRDTPTESNAQAEMLTQVMEQIRPSSTSGNIKLEIWPAIEDSQKRVFHDGDMLPISLLADKDCYVKLYHIWSDGNEQMIFPTTNERDNKLRANRVRTVLNQKNSQYQLWEPFGEEIIYAIVSSTPFDGIEGEMRRPEAVRATTESIRANRGGGNVSAVKNTQAEAPQEALAWFRFTILPKDYREETFSFSRPADVRGTLRELERDIKSRGGTFKGSDARGEFSAEDFQGAYTVDGDRIKIEVRYPAHQSIIERGAATRGAGGGKVPFSFSFPKPADINQAVAKARTEIIKKGGTFTGDEKGGTFKVMGIKGEYSVPMDVVVSISEKPIVVSVGLIEKGVPEYFGVK